MKFCENCSGDGKIDLMPGASQETLYLVLSVSIALLTIFFCVALIYIILVLRDTSKILEKGRDTVEKINSFVVKPVQLISTIIEQVRPMIERAVKRVRRKKGGE